MAYSIQQIQNQILAAKNANPTLSGLTSPSQVSIYNLWSYVTAVGINIEEVLWDTFQEQLEETILNAPIGTNQWVQNMVFQFQYDATTPQVVTLSSGFTATYPVVDVTKQIISRCSVVTNQQRLVVVKVATQNPPQALSTLQLSSLQSYLDEINFAGVQYEVFSYSADNLTVGAQIYYNGQYGSTIQQSVLNAFNNYMANIPFNGYVVVSQIEQALLSVPGVEDVVLNNVWLRAASQTIPQATQLVSNNDELIRRVPTFAGYVINETTSGYTFNNLFQFIPA